MAGLCDETQSIGVRARPLATQGGSDHRRDSPSSIRQQAACNLGAKKARRGDARRAGVRPNKEGYSYCWGAQLSNHIPAESTRRGAQAGQLVGEYVAEFTSVMRPRR
jgi:hypothetical protein